MMHIGTSTGVILGFKVGFSWKLWLCEQNV